MDKLKNQDDILATKEITTRFAIVISPAWPGRDSGYQIANDSSLRLYKSQTESIAYIGITEKEYDGSGFPNVDFFHVPSNNATKLVRFLKSLTSKLPAVCQKTHVNIIDPIRRIVAKKKWPLSDVTLIFEDIPVASMIEGIKKSIKPAKFIIRSHNVLSEAFEGFSQSGSLPLRLAWKLETSRIKRLEKRLLRSEIPFYAISSRDSCEYVSRFNSKPDNVIGIRFPPNRFDGINKFQSNVDYKNTIIHLGTLDLRKMHGLNFFINEIFLELRRQFPDLKLVLGGKNSEKLHNPKLGIIGQGFVDSESQFMSQGNFFLNPQIIGTGVKLKSLIAMGYEKTLLSTEKGVEGIDCEDGTHFLLLRNAEESIKRISSMLLEPSRFCHIPKEAKKLVLSHYIGDY